MSKNAILTPLLFLLQLPLMAQDERSVLQNYKYRYRLYRQSSLSFNTYFQGYNSRSKDTVGRIDNLFRNNSSSLNFQFDRQSNYNTDNKIHQGYLFFYANASMSKNDNGLSKYKNLTGQTGASITNTYYKTGSLKFNRIHTGVHGYFNEYSNIRKLNPPISNLNSNSWINGNLELSKGRGRIENISDASFAAFWLRDMRSNGIIKVYTANEIEQIAKAITKARNTRIIDFRFRTINQIEMLDSAFRDLGLLTNTGAAYYTTLYDHYLYANNFQRFHGKNSEFGLRISPDVNYSYEYYQFNDTSIHRSSNTNNYNVSTSIFYKGVSNIARTINGQWNFFNRYELGFENTKQYGRFYNIINYLDSEVIFTPFASVSGGIEYMYMYNTRNYVRSYINTTVRRDFFENIQQTYFIIYCGLNYYHWFSPSLQLRVEGNLSVNGNNDYYLNPKKKANEFQMQPSAGISLNYFFY